MKRVKFATRHKSAKFNGKAAAALAILQLLDSAGAAGLRVPEILQGLIDGAGILMKGTTDEQHVSMLLQRLISLGAVDHPPGPGGSRYYVLKCWPQILRS
jgi:hypothetical protein